LLGPYQLALTIPVTPETATGGLIRPGDAVQVLLTANPGKADSQTTVILPRVTVYDAGYEAGSTIVRTTGDRSSGQGPLARLTLLVTQDQAVRLAQAKWNGELDVALLPPAE
jgi:Flp pilus assembly protein CpaB